jgi:two-component system nitrogen regulation response regulator GlnG
LPPQPPETRRTILVVDDDRAIRHALRSALTNDRMQVVEAASIAETLQRLETDAPALILLDLHLPDGDGMNVLKQVRTASPDLPIVLITSEPGSDAAITASRHGARDYLTKPLEMNRVRETVGRLLAPRQAANACLLRGDGGIFPCGSEDLLIGKSRAMQEVFKSIGRVARQRVSVLISGESGTGKDLVARAIWEHSDRAKRPLLAVNCAALSNALLESELFGHEQGAFTGATRRHIGRLEACHRGTLFLDEVGDMHSIVQAKLLRVLQERRFTRVGGDEEIETDVRILCATNRNLTQMCRTGHFREDLYHRLNGFSITVPPLRERGEDARHLLAFFLHRYNQRLSGRIERIEPTAARILANYWWPGNVRELETTLSQAMLNAEGTTISTDDLPARLFQPRPSSEMAGSDVKGHHASQENRTGGRFEKYIDELISSPKDTIHASAIEYVERYVLVKVLAAVGGNQSAAARRLGITRGSLRFKLKTLGINIDNRVHIS